MPLQKFLWAMAAFCFRFVHPCLKHHLVYKQCLPSMLTVPEEWLVATLIIEIMVVVIVLIIIVIRW